MNSSRVKNLLLITLTIVFAWSSWQFVSRYFFLGSLEARTFISKRAVVIQWAQYRKDAPFHLPDYLEPDTFKTFIPADGFDLVDDPARIPALYIKNGESIFPLLLFTKNSGMGGLLVRLVAYFSSPEMGLVFTTWLLGMMAFGISLFYIRKTSDQCLPFVFIACFSPPMFFYLYSQYPVSGFVFVLVLSVFTIMRFWEKPGAFALAGAIGGMAFFTQMSSALYIPAMCILFWPKIRKNLWPLFLGFLPFLIFVLLYFNVEFMKDNLEERNLLKGLAVYLDSLWHFLLDFSNPERHMSHLTPGQLFSERPFSYVTFFLTWIPVIILSWKLIEKKDLLRLGSITVIHCIIITLIARDFNDDYYLYVAMGIYLVSVLFLSSIKKTETKKSPIVIASLVALLTGRILSSSAWTMEFMKSTWDLENCVWTYSCMVRDWNQNPKLIGDHPLITLYFLDVGQIEYFSGEKIIPIHFSPRYEREPTEDEVADFLRRFPYKEFRILGSGTRPKNGRTLLSYLSQETVNSLNLKIELLKEYNFRAQERRYRLLKVTRP